MFNKYAFGFRIEELSNISNDADQTDIEKQKKNIIAAEM